MDSAEGALDNQYYSMYGIRWHKVHKLKEVDMIDRVQDLLAQGRVYYLDQPDNRIFIKEHQKYQWDENTLQSDSPKVIKEDDHTVDAFKYCVLDNERDFGLKW
jgi:phage terminase large subunit